ncbi:hypothetical protein Back2_20870 [Nocardioides baekrokdamisoli]|uniref:HTH luxR-type domain-containing protein n=1 Tax=Nocardioides baekrokdamisoli TaxID=1804624 RepID=A0A3G9IFH7_9ACTN|nr:LuxR family transcriptional regulator [Nocardioides baekrokdamisoli]BBH17800.1 hypothetical protein Back2_20870 [Nocardioides baekrokdamisoli]
MRAIREYFTSVPVPYVVLAALAGAVLYLAERATPWAPFWSANNTEAAAFAHGLLALWAVGLAAAPLLAVRWPVVGALLASAPLVLGVMAEHQWPFVIYVALMVIAVVASWSRPRTAVLIALAALAPVLSVAVGRSEMIVPYGARIDAWGSGPVDVSLVVGYVVATSVIAVIAVIFRRRVGRALRKREAVQAAADTDGRADASQSTALVEAVASLSRREHEVFLELAAGRSNAEIAESLQIGVETVKSHVAEILRKLGLRDRVHAVVYAYENGLVAVRHP